MTHIVSPARFPTKKAFKEAVEKDPARVFLDDPAIVNPLSGSVQHVVAIRGSVTVTNHPRRSWFANVAPRNGILRVS